MDYKNIMCKFCKECIGMKLTRKLIKTESKLNSDTIVTRCENYYSKEEFKSDIV